MKKQLKIAIVEPVGGHGGMDYYDYGLAYGLGQNNINVYYYTCDKTHTRTFYNVNTIKSFINVWDSTFILKVYNYYNDFIKSLKDARKKNIEIIHLHFFTFRIIDYFILKRAKNLGFKIVATIHDVNAFDKSSNYKIEKKCYNLINGIIVHNQSSKNDLINKHNNIKNVNIIPHGNYKPFIKEIKLESENSIPHLLFFGQIKKIKGLDILIKAVYIIKNKGYNFKLTIAGKVWKDDLSYYKNLIDNLKLNSYIQTDFRYIPDKEVSDFYSKSDLIVLPYTEIYQSGILLLSMSYGKPVLCSDLKAFKDIIIDGENGYLFKNRNEEDLANKLIKIFDNKDHLKYTAINAKNIINDKFDWINIGKQTLLFYNQL